MTDQPTVAVWVDGDPLMEAIASAAYERCNKVPGHGITNDDPRNIAAAVAATARMLVLREMADDCDEAGGMYAARSLNDHAAGAFDLMETFRRKADQIEYTLTPCSFGGCEPGGEPCSTHERLMGHAEGDHELCGPECSRFSPPA